jgi:hypothetical protein
MNPNRGNIAHRHRWENTTKIDWISGDGEKKVRLLVNQRNEAKTSNLERRADHRMIFKLMNEKLEKRISGRSTVLENGQAKPVAVANGKR